MPKCTVCGKKFDTLSALREHHRAVHPSARFVAPKPTLSRNLLTVMIVILIVVGSLIGYLIYSQQSQTTTTTTSGLLGSPISAILLNNMTTVSDSTLNRVGSTQSGVTSPTLISNAVTLTSGGKPEFLYIGADFCPHCAAERWSMVVALSKFGTFRGVEYMQSSPSDGNIATITFSNATYITSYNFTFVAVENEDRNGHVIQTPNAQDQQLWNQYNANTYPFIDIGGMYILRVAQFDFNALSNMNWTQIGSQLNNPQSSTAKLIDGAANQLIAAICKIDGNSPASVCSQPFAQNVSFSNANAVSYSQLLIAGATQERHPRPAIFAPRRD
jgi:hypothetical protein